MERSWKLYHCRQFGTKQSASFLAGTHGVGGSERSNLLLSLQERMEWDLKRLDMIIHQLDNRKSTYTANDIIVAFQNRVNEQSFFYFMQGIIKQLELLNKIRTSETYTAALNSFMKFRYGQDILLCEIDSDMI